MILKLKKSVRDIKN